MGIRDFASRPYPVNLVRTPPEHVARELAAALDFWRLPAPPGPVLEFGSGTGRLTKPLLDRGYQVTAIEPDGRAQEALAALASGYPGQLTAVGQTSELAPPGRFAAAVGADVLHHAPAEAILSAAREFVHAEGVIAFDEPDGAHPGWWVFVTLTGRLSNELGLARTTRRQLEHAFARVGCAHVRTMRWAPGVRGGLGPRWFYAATNP